MSDKVAEREAKIEITEILHRYCRAVDRGDWDTVREGYHDDAIENHGPYQGGVDGFIDFVKSRAEDPAVIRLHHLTTINITVVGDVAYSEAYYTCPGRLAGADEQGVGALRVIDGRYVDRFERRNGKWRVAHRVAVVDFVRYQSALDDDFATAFARGASDRTDPSYWEGLTAPTTTSVG
ncbi:nuclear transport factor 2 family protein [Actinomadura madurae]|uniref:nuclear transport factor 2 family protein n=1 Tax=Actinomadura madurae TaxID=1993 RepID=UPI00399B3EB8